MSGVVIERASKNSIRLVPLESRMDVVSEMATQYRLHIMGRIKAELMGARVLNLKRIADVFDDVEARSLDKERLDLVHRAGGAIPFVGIALIPPGGAAPLTIEATAVVVDQGDPGPDFEVIGD